MGIGVTVSWEIQEHHGRLGSRQGVVRREK